jgi:WXG100 family type VII secretion target
MSDIIKMEYALMDDMSKTFSQSVEMLQDTSQQMQEIASKLEDGALLGRGGDAFSDAIRSKLCPAISRLVEKYEELAKDVKDAKQDMQSADQDSAGLYN